MMLPGNVIDLGAARAARGRPPSSVVVAGLDPATHGAPAPQAVPTTPTFAGQRLMPHPRLQGRAVEHPRFRMRGTVVGRGSAAETTLVVLLQLAGNPLHGGTSHGCAAWDEREVRLLRRLSDPSAIPPFPPTSPEAA